jgi:hypothetical protein
MSARWSMSGMPSACSGAMYCGVPMTTPTTVMADFSPCFFASPRSTTRGMPSLPTMMFSGLMSRCTTPACSAHASAEATARTVASASRSANFVFALSMPSTVMPSMNSKAMKCMPFDLSIPCSMTPTMFGWRSAAAACASRWKRSTYSESLASCGERTLSAMRRSRLLCFALKTLPMPPSPSSLMSSKPPTSRSFVGPPGSVGGSSDVVASAFGAVGTEVGFDDDLSATIVPDDGAPGAAEVARAKCVAIAMITGAKRSSPMAARTCARKAAPFFCSLTTAAAAAAVAACASAETGTLREARPAGPTLQIPAA